MESDLNPADFVASFLHEHGRGGKPDGRRLFEYKCRKHEYRELRTVLRTHGDPVNLRQQVDGYGQAVGDELHLDDEAIRMMAAFVLYGAEWFRRHEPPPRRTWARLLAGIQWPTADYPELYPAIVQGLRWWRTMPIRTPSKTLYFDTLAYQGGRAMEGLLVMEFRLVDESSNKARYAPTSRPPGLEVKEIRVRKRKTSPAPPRITATFDLGWN